MGTFDNSTIKSKNSYDTVAPPNLVEYMMKSWKPKAPRRLKPIRNAANFKHRREVLSKAFPGELLVIPTGHLKVRSNDSNYRFRASSDFYYLTGNQEPDCTLVLVPERDGHRHVLFVEPNPGKTDATFFTDRVKGELWVGARMGVPESHAIYAVDDCRPLSEMGAFLKVSGVAAPQGIRVLRGFSPTAEEWALGERRANAEQAAKDQALAVTLSEMRLYKDPEEVRELSEAIRATKVAFEDVIRRMKTAKTERELEGVFYTRARMEGNDVGYYSIIASGAHGCTLHYNVNSGDLNKRDLLLMDAGVEGNSLYTADITRTLPIGGKFSREQREIYELVLAAQAAAIKAVRPGVDFMEPNRHAMQVLAEGLERLKILPTSAEEALREENQFYKRYSLHNVSHMLGLDVHDCAQARAENYKYGKLIPGMVLTVEPGLYFQLDDLTVPAKYRGIGIRIEDDCLVTKTGCRNLSAGIPSKVEDLERWIKGLWKKSA